MGSIRFSLDPDVLDLDFKGAGIFWALETGTWTGRTTALLASHFRRVWTVEADKEVYGRLPSALSQPSTRYVHGDSASVLPKILVTEREPCFVWLDAHWFPRLAERRISIPPTTPLLKELMALSAWQAVSRSFIAVDDVHLFHHEDDRPNYVPKNWPKWSDIEQVTRTWPQRQIVFEDVLYFVPDALLETFLDYIEHRS